MPEINFTACDRRPMVTAILNLAMCLAVYLVVLTLAGEAVMAGQAPEDSNREETSPAGSVEASLQKELDLLLLGTVVLPEPREPMAIIQVGKTGEQKLYWLGDVVKGGRLTKILRDRVTLNFAEIEVELRLAGGARSTPAEVPTVTERVQPPLRQTDGVFWRVERQSLDDLSRAPELITHVTPLDAGGVRVDKVQADGFFHKLGLQQGDIIRNINGQVPGADLSLQQAVAQSETGETMLRLEIERQGHMDVPLYYEFDP